MQYDVIVVGGGHAGCEAALASARLGAKTLILTISPDTIAAMSCNPAIGGPAAKSHLVREIDALGGQMAKVIDCSYLNIRRINESRGPAVAALRAQADKKLYQSEMVLTLERTENLSVKQGLVTELLVEDGKVAGVALKSGRKYQAKAVVLTTGTFLNGEVVMGNIKYPGGRQGEPSAQELSRSLKQNNIRLRRFQTATPPRIHKKSINFNKILPQALQDQEWGFSWEGLSKKRMQEPCWVTTTTRETIQVIRENLHHSPIVSGSINSKGPHFCPSIDRKVINFPDKNDHQIFLEPEGFYTEEVYLLGLTTAMPEEIQEKILATIPGLENVEIIRPGYAVEYDCLESFQFTSALESKVVTSLFTAGQINGTSGYEEAAAQGLIAGINAARKVFKLPLFIPERTNSYIGVLIDDLAVKGTSEPYRMMTSLAEFRLFLRLDNSLVRLGEEGYKLKLVSESGWAKRRQLLESIAELQKLLEETKIKPEEDLRAALKLQPVNRGYRLKELITHPEISINDFLGVFPELQRFPEPVWDYVWNEIKLEGYLKRQAVELNEMEMLEKIILPGKISYHELHGLSECGCKIMETINPHSLGQALRIPDLCDADRAVLILNFRKDKGEGLSYYESKL